MTKGVHHLGPIKGEKKALSIAEELIELRGNNVIWGVFIGLQRWRGSQRQHLAASFHWQRQHLGQSGVTAPLAGAYGARGLGSIQQ